MPSKPCLTCGQLSPNTRCPTHQPRTTTQRGYGHLHQQNRRTWAAQVALGQAICARYNCGRPITPGQLWDMGHPDYGSAGGPEHRSCNRAAGARTANHHRRLARRRTVRTSHSW